MNSVVTALLQRVLSSIDWGNILGGVLSKVNLEQILTNFLKSFVDRYLQSKGLALSVDENDPDFTQAVKDAAAEINK